MPKRFLAAGLACLLAAWLGAQTKITVESILSPGQTGLLAVLTSGVKVVSIGTGLALDETTGVLTAVQPAAVREKFDVLAVRQGDGTWLLPDSPTVVTNFSLNGLRMVPTADYTLSGASITFTAAQSAAAANTAAIVAVSYRY